ncbi:aminopeptidase P family protein [Candidatus Peregrinibacteria bacterium]|nr:aminopeptidase P family protein [Candidatus Peregrinibacteria bacterium]
MLPKTILVVNKTNIRYLSGFSGTAGALTMRGKRGWLFTDARYHLVAKKVLPAGFGLIDVTAGFEKPWMAFLKKYRVRRLGVEGGTITLRSWKQFKKMSAGVKFIDIKDTLDQKRVVKKPLELNYINKAQKITDVIFCVLKKWLKPGVSEKSIAWKIESLAHDFGADDISFPPIIGINEHSASPHHQNTDRKLKRGDLILIDMGVIFRGYCSDMTRVLFTNTPTAEQSAIYQLVLKAQETAIKKLKAGITGKQADQWARSVIEKAGYGKNFGHSLGHGVGLDIHELPNLSQKYSGKIPAGSVVTVEPGVYLLGKFGVRLEDMVVVGKSGVRNITKSPKAIQKCVIRI